MLLPEYVAFLLFNAIVVGWFVFVCWEGLINRDKWPKDNLIGYEFVMDRSFAKAIYLTKRHLLLFAIAVVAIKYMFLRYLSSAMDFNVPPGKGAIAGEIIIAVLTGLTCYVSYYYFWEKKITWKQVNDISIWTTRQRPCFYVSEVFTPESDGTKAYSDLCELTGNITGWWNYAVLCNDGKMFFIAITTPLPDYDLVPLESIERGVEISAIKNRKLRDAVCMYLNSCQPHSNTIAGYFSYTPTTINQLENIKRWTTSRFTSLVTPHFTNSLLRPFPSRTETPSDKENELLPDEDVFGLIESVDNNESIWLDLYPFPSEGTSKKTTFEFTKKFIAEFNSRIKDYFECELKKVMQTYQSQNYLLETLQFCAMFNAYWRDPEVVRLSVTDNGFKVTIPFTNGDIDVFVMEGSNEVMVQSNLDLQEWIDNIPDKYPTTYPDNVVKVRIDNFIRLYVTPTTTSLTGVDKSTSLSVIHRDLTYKVMQTRLLLSDFPKAIKSIVPCNRLVAMCDNYETIAGSVIEVLTIGIDLSESSPDIFSDEPSLYPKASPVVFYSTECLKMIPHTPVMLTGGYALFDQFLSAQTNQPRLHYLF